MIDYELRIITPSLIELLKKKYKSELILRKKIPISFIKNNRFLKSYKSYLIKAKKINEVYFRGLPVNNKKFYFKQELELQDTFNSIMQNIKKIKGNKIMQLPNPDFVTFSEFERMVKIDKNISGFELIASWHGKTVNNKKYSKFFSFISELELPLSLEVDYIFRNSLDNLANFFLIINKYPKIKYWLPHLGCGAFLHWDKIKEACRYEPILLSSTKNLNQWLDILSLPKFKNIPVKFASDHPFNNNSSIYIYQNWLNQNKIK